MKIRFIFQFLMLCTLAGASLAAPLGTGFTYQGELQDGGIPADGNYDFEFELFDDSAAGTMLGGKVSLENVPVVNGVFSVELDFGAGPFAGDQLWLEISVRDGASIGGFTGLLPRQKLTAAPYALHAEMVAMDAITSSEIANNTIMAADIGADAVGLSELAANSVDSAEIISGAVGSSEIADGSVGDADIADVERTLLFDAAAIGGSANSSLQGLEFGPTGGDSGNLVIQRPADWDGSSAIRVELFTQGDFGAGTGTAQMFIRPRDYNDGDTFADTSGVVSDTRSYTTTGQYRVFTVSLTAASLPKDWWYLVIQRNPNTSGFTYPNDITLLSAAVSYTAVR